MFQFVLWIMYRYIGNIRTFWNKKLYMKTCYSSKSLWILTISLVWFFWAQNVSILPSLNISQGAKCFNTPKLYTTHEKSRKSQSVTGCCRYGKRGVMDVDTDYFSCHEVEALEYFQSLDMRCNNKSGVTKRVSGIVLQLYSML